MSLKTKKAMDYMTLIFTVRGVFEIRLEKTKWAVGVAHE
ncbi:hypothetical protein PULV_a2390 [Pseudoalteromonas ulvae UL12]|nr:hypothetical protein [Pseudoalteromonas ulvae UL12]